MSKKGDVSAESKVGNAFNGRRKDSVQEVTYVVLITDFILVKEHNHPFLLQKRRHRLLEDNLGESFSTLKAEDHVKKSLGRRAQNHRVISCIFRVLESQD